MARALSRHDEREREAVSPRSAICPAPGCGNLQPCPAHPSPLTSRGRQHRRARAQTLAEELTCWLCGRVGTPENRLTADHVVPRAHGGRDERANLRAAHESCNKRRGEGYAPEKISSDRDAPRTFPTLLAVRTGLEVA